ncbi:MAG: hypothetical protein K0Q52_158 [Microbacterium sp.]|jgi:hypothetical protein|nr:hypothetical protein [Microbacterium sp.]
MTRITKTVTGYECGGCGTVAQAASPFSTDMPEGVYLTIRRVTEAHNHYLTDEIYTCSKECAIQLVQYGIHANATAFRPIGRIQQ